MNSNLFFDRCERTCFFILGMIIRPFVKVKRNQIICWSFNFSKYACNPRMITEYILEHYEHEYEVYWAFKKGIDVSSLPSGVHVLNKNSLRYLFVLYSSHFVINNMRNDFMESYFIKKSSQKYVMTWHGSMSIKKVEKDAEIALPKHYIKNAKYDSQMCDLMLSGCKFYTKLYKESFWYKGDVLEKGTPRCDVLFKDSSNIRQRIFTQYNIASNKKIVLYAPTFRSDYSLEYYKLDWQDLIGALKRIQGNDYVVLVRLHPNLASHKGFNINDYVCNNVLDVTKHPDIQELLLISDFLITDYSSSMFDISLINKPCFIYTKDLDKYDRGFYISITKLPFPLATSDEELIKNIESFDRNSYQNKVNNFYSEFVGNVENGNACKAFVDWMKTN